MKRMTQAQFKQIIEAAKKAGKMSNNIAPLEALCEPFLEPGQNIAAIHSDAWKNAALEKRRDPIRYCYAHDSINLYEGYFTRGLIRILLDLNDDQLLAEVVAFDASVLIQLKSMQAGSKDYLNCPLFSVERALEDPFWQANKKDFLFALLTESTIFNTLQQSQSEMALKWSRKLVVLHEYHEAIHELETMSQAALQLKGELALQLLTHFRTISGNRADKVARIGIMAPYIWPALLVLLPMAAISTALPSDSRKQLTSEIATSLCLKILENMSCHELYYLDAPAPGSIYTLAKSYHPKTSQGVPHLTETIHAFKKTIMPAIISLTDDRVACQLLSNTVDPLKDLGSFMNRHCAEFSDKFTPIDNPNSGTRKGVFEETKQAEDRVIANFISVHGDKIPKAMCSLLSASLIQVTNHYNDGATAPLWASASLCADAGHDMELGAL
jgi:hypothetical protein